MRSVSCVYHISYITELDQHSKSVLPMKTSGASILVLAIVVLSHFSTVEGQGLGLGLGNIIGSLKNLTNPVLDNLTSPVLGHPPTANNVSGVAGALNLTNIVGPLNNLTGGVVGGLSPSLNNATGGALNLTNIVGPLNNLTNGIVIGLDPTLNNVTGALNLTNIVGTLNNITVPLVDILTNLTGPPSSLAVSTNVTVTVTLNLPPAADSNSTVFSFPESITIVPLGLTQVAFSVYTVEGENASSIPLTLKVPILSYLNFPVSGSASVTVDFPVGSTLRILGITKTITRLFFGVSWQTFPQLSSVVISQLLPDGSHSDPLYTLDIPALIYSTANVYT